jgi:magnesium chelatase subunit H
LKLAVLYVGSSLPAPLRQAERDIRARHKIDLSVALHNCGDDLYGGAWEAVERDLAESELVFIIHVTNQENANRIRSAIEKYNDRHRAVIAINCLPELMRCSRLGSLDFANLIKSKPKKAKREASPAQNLTRKLGSWMADSIKGGLRVRYTKLIDRLPAILRLLPGAGKLGDIKNYLFLYCYFLQPTPANVRSMLLYAIKHYVPGHSRLKVPPPESLPAVGIYHPDAAKLFDSFDAYSAWYARSGRRELKPHDSVGLLLMRPQIVSRSRGHYDRLIRAIEEEGLGVVPAISTFLDNRESCRTFFVDQAGSPRVSQIASLTGFSFVGGPAMHDSRAAMEFLEGLNAPLRSLVSLDVQTVENWESGRLGLNPIQTAMQVAVPEIDGATEPFVFGGVTQTSDEPVAIEERCVRIARRIARWNRLRNARREELQLALVLFCFPPNKGNIGTAAELDVFASLLEILTKLGREGYQVIVPESADELRRIILEENGDASLSARVAYRMSIDEYRTLCPYVDDVEREWGSPPGRLNSNGCELLILGVKLGNAFIGVQPTFGYEGDPMRLLMAKSGAPHHGFMAFYTYIEKVLRADAVIHLGTHGALEFMPGKQAGLSSSCWPDRLIGELPNIYVYSVNNPSEGTIAKRRSYAELVSYLTPPIDNAGLYKGLASLKELLTAYRQSSDERERERLFEAIEAEAKLLSV